MSTTTYYICSGAFQIVYFSSCNSRINDENDELAPFIKQLHFHEDTTPDLLIDLTQFKANRQVQTNVD